MRACQSAQAIKHEAFLCIKKKTLMTMDSSHISIIFRQKQRGEKNGDTAVCFADMQLSFCGNAFAVK